MNKGSDDEDFERFADLSLDNSKGKRRQKRITIYGTIVTNDNFKLEFEFKFESGLSTFESLKSRVLKLIEEEGYALIITQIFDFTIDAEIFSIEKLVDGHSYQVYVAPKLSSVEQATVNITLRINKEAPICLEALIGSTISSVVKKHTKNIKCIGQTKKKSSNFNDYIMCAKSTIVDDEGGDFVIDAIFMDLMETSSIDQSAEENEKEDLALNFETAKKYQHLAIQNVRKLFNGKVDRELARTQVFGSGILTNLVQFSGIADLHIQRTISFILLQLSFGTENQIQKLVYSGTIPCLLNLLNHKDEGVFENAISSLLNISSHGPTFCRVLYKNQLVQYLLHAFYKNEVLSNCFLRKTTNLILNLSSFLDIELKRSDNIHLIQILMKIPKSDDAYLKPKILKSIVVLLHKTNEIDCLIERLKPDFIISMALNENIQIRKDALNVIQMVLLKKDAGRIYLKYGLLDALQSCLKYDELKSSVFSCLNLITCDSQHQTQALLKTRILNEALELADSQELNATFLDIWTKLVLNADLNLLLYYFDSQTIKFILEKFETYEPLNEISRKSFWDRMDLLVERDNEVEEESIFEINEENANQIKEMQEEEKVEARPPKRVAIKQRNSAKKRTQVKQLSPIKQLKKRVRTYTAMFIKKS